MKYFDLEEQRLRQDREEQGEVAFTCARCGKEIRKNEEYYDYERDCLCEECFDEIQKDEKFNSKRIAGDDDDC